MSHRSSVGWWFTVAMLVGAGILLRLTWSTQDETVARAVRRAVRSCDVPATELQLITLATIGDCASCREHLRFADERMLAADSLRHLVLVYAPPGLRVEAEAAMRSQTVRPVCIDPDGSWLAAARDRRLPATLLLGGSVTHGSWSGPIAKPADVSALWRAVDSVRRIGASAQDVR